jgi:hypothetical protein
VQLALLREMKLTGSGYPPLNTEGVPLHNFPVPSLMKTADPARMYVLGDPRYSTCGFSYFVVIRLTGSDYLPHKTESVTLFLFSLLMKILLGCTSSEIQGTCWFFIFKVIRLTGSDSLPHKTEGLTLFSVMATLPSITKKYRYLCTAFLTPLSPKMWSLVQLCASSGNVRTIKKASEQCQN